MDRFESGEIYDIIVYSESYIRDSIRILTARTVLDSITNRGEPQIPLGVIENNYKPFGLTDFQQILFESVYPRYYRRAYNRFWIEREPTPVPVRHTRDPETGEYV